MADGDPPPSPSQSPYLLDNTGLTRPWSNLGGSSGVERRSGSVFGSGALVAGTTVGAGILALPAVSLDAGFVPATIALTGCWLYMGATGLLIAETCLNEMCSKGRTGLGLLGAAEALLGTAGGRLAGGCFLLIHWALLVAYSAQGGALFAAIAAPLLPEGGGVAEALAASPAIGPVAFVSLWGGVVLLLPPAALEAVNSALVAGVVASFGGLLALGFGAPGFEPARLLAHADVASLPAALPVMLLSLVYHNVVPVVVRDLEGDRVKIRQAVLGGSAVPLLMFVAWTSVFLGSVEPGSTLDPIEALRQAEGGGEGAALLGGVVAAFSELAIVTSFIGFVLGLVDFLEDALGPVLAPLLGAPPVDGGGGGGSGAAAALARAPYFAVALLPPLGCALVNPDIFLSALNVAGAFGITMLFGVVPAAMAAKQRPLAAQRGAGAATGPLVPGGGPALALIAGLALALFLQQGAAIVGRYTAGWQ